MFVLDDFSDSVPPPSTPPPQMMAGCNPMSMQMAGIMRKNSDMQKLQMMQMMQMKQQQQMMQMMQMKQQQQMMLMQRQQQQQMMLMQRQPQAVMVQQEPKQNKYIDSPFPDTNPEKVRRVKEVPGTEAELFYYVGGEEYEIKINRMRPVVTMGRHTEVDIRLGNDTSISRFHATIMTVISDDEKSAKFIFKDTSQYGSYVNDKKVTECELTDGSRIRLGNSLDFIYFISKKKTAVYSVFLFV